MLEPWAINNSKWKKKLAWMLYQKKDLKRVTAFHATAESEAESIRRLGFKQPIAVIPNGVELPELNQSSVINHQISDKKTALFLSRINPKKGLPMLLDVWRKLAPENWRLVIAGNDDSNHLPVLERKIAELGLSDQVEIVGPLFGVDKEAAFHNADLFVLPSYSENFGIVVTEALGYHVPVLTTTGCPWQELETHDCGWWVDPTPEGVLAGLQQALMATPDRLSEMGMRGRKLVEEKYQWPGIAERMAAFYEWLINGGKQPEFVVKWLE
jgi:glycosyltransferase involved in cell wall biosynthesis